MPEGKILIVDDEENIRKTLIGILGDEGYRAEAVPSAEEGMERLASGKFDLLLLDVQLPGMDGISFFEKLAENRGAPATLIMSGHATVDMAVQATRLGAFDFLEKPIDPERLMLTVAHALEIRGLKAENRALRRAGAEMVGRSNAMRSLRDEVNRAAPSNGRVLITGENGTGKELVARAIHAGSERHMRPFIKVNCAAIPKDLIESELFGHEKGAFTGATSQRIGKIEQADGGTLLLDEVGDMSLETQAKLLRVLESKELERVGGGSTISFDVRVVAATNKDLKKEIAEGNFREDLYYRLAVIPIHVPPLRERGGDVEILLEHFLQLFADESGRLPKSFSEEAIATLDRHQWPGNIRELRNLVERLQIMAEGTVIGEEIVVGSLRTGEMSDGSVEGRSLRAQVERFEIELIARTLRRKGGNVAETARELQTDRANLHRKMKRYGINPRAEGE